MEIFRIAKKILGLGYICDNCLGRQFAQLLTGMTNKERGKIIRNFLGFEHETRPLDVDLTNFYDYKFRFRKKTEIKKPEKCIVCDGLFENLDKFAKEAKKKLRGIDFDSFSVANKLSSDLVIKEENLWEKIGIKYCEPIKAEINREFGKILFKKLGKKVSETGPDVIVLLDLKKNKILIKKNPLFIYGGYKKLVRGIPQTRLSGYKESVEQLIGEKVKKESIASDYILHGCVGLNTNVILENYCTLPIKFLKKRPEKLITFDIKNRKLHKSNVLDYFELEPKKINLNVLKVSTKETGREILVTEDHEFYTPKGMVVIKKLKLKDKVAVLPYKPVKFLLSKNKIILNGDDIRKVISKYYPKYRYKDKIIEKLENRDLIPLKANDQRLLILTRILAFLFGDGHVRCIKNRDISLEFYGQEKDLYEIKKDLDLLGFKHSKIRKRKSYTIIKDYYGKERTISGMGKSFVTYSRTLWFLLVGLGAPVGDKIVNKLKIPKWIENSNIIIKREFLASLLGCEIDKPRLDKRKYNKKSFNTPRFSMNKIEKELNNGIKFINKISHMLKEFGVDTLKYKLVKYTTRKDENKSIKIILDINNRFENLINFFGNVGFRYCKEKEKLARLAFEYLSIKKNVLDKRKVAYREALKLKKKGFKLSEIHKKLVSKYVTKKNLWLWINNKVKEENIKVPNKFPNFDYWLKYSTNDLDAGLVWETINSIQKVNINKVCDITTNPTHTFFANGFLVSNCGREDIDVKCLDYRPFVIEISEPKKRKINLKKIEKEVNKSNKINIKQLCFTNKKKIVKVKNLKPDKTYEMILRFNKKIENPEKLKKIIGVINQKTPRRVLPRRADIIRKRKVKHIKWKIINNKTVVIEVRAESGLYVKELVTGDDGRTKPNLAEIFNNKIEIKELNVKKIWL